MIASINPATGDVLEVFAAHGPEEVERRVTAAWAAQRIWRQVDVEARTDVLRRAAAILRRDAEILAGTITLEMGKPLAQSDAEIEKCARALEYYAELAPRFVADEPVATEAADSRILFEPLGVILAIMPWNFPFWQFFRFAAPALAAGNGAVLKHASNVPRCALAVEAVLAEAGAPVGLFPTLLLEGAAVMDLVDDPRIAAVTLTGSSAVGRAVAARAGAALKKQVLELGGSDPFLVLADADVEAAAAVAARSRFTNAGQSCVSAKRFIVEHAVADRFVQSLAGHMQDLRMGDPMNRATTLGPLARPDLRDELHRQVEASADAGATVVIGGHIPDRPGAFYEPTLLDHVEPGHAVFNEETFGPAGAVVRVGDAEEAVRLANATEYGLGAAIWSADTERAVRLGRDIEAGAVFVNGMVASDPRLPFGGIKSSGYGRELGVYGLREFVNVKTLWIG